VSARYGDWLHPEFAENDKDNDYNYQYNYGDLYQFVRTGDIKKPSH
jgi:hypothetical protein